MHVLWGWLQVGAVLRLASDNTPAWARYHPHVVTAGRFRKNSLYVATAALQIGNEITTLPGGGAFDRFDARLQLTKPGANRSVWILPSAFAPAAALPPLGYHHEPSRWTQHADHVELQTVGRGQEFVLDLDRYPAVLQWIGELFSSTG